MGERKTYNLKHFLKRTALGSLLALAVLFVFLPVFTRAQPLDTGIEFGTYTGLVETDIRIIIAKIIRAFLGVLGIVAIGFTLYGGYLYMTAAGDEDKIKTAKRILKNMTIGLAIILSAFAITQFVINMLTEQYQGGGEGEPVPPGQEGFCPNCGFLGSVVESHYPGRGATEIPRNTKVVITFKYEMLPSTLIFDSNNNTQFGDTLGADAGNNDHATTTFKIYPSTEGESAALAPENFDVFLAADKRTYVFKPKILLGSPLQPTNYTIKLTDGIKRADGSNAFGAIGNYSWSFTVSTIVDLTPPEVTSVIPVPQGDKYPRNIILQMNFSEPVDPISASGIFRLGQSAPNNFQNIKAAVLEGSNPLISGNYQITNQYHTVEFKTNDQCGVNPCGQAIYCLPGDKNILATIKSASVDPANKPQAQITATLYDGVVDMAGNSLNGGGELRRNGQNKLILDPGLKTQSQWQAATGKILDDFIWKFDTSAILDTTAPILTNVTPGSLVEGVATSTPLAMSFNKPMSIGSFREIVLRTNKQFNVGYSYAGKNFIGSTEVTSPEQGMPERTVAEILHSDFWQKPPNSTETDAVYYPFIPSLLNDIYQNCFYPAVLQGSNECVRVGTNMDAINQDKLTNTNPSCFDLQASSYKGFCLSGEACPFSPAPYNAP